MPKIYESPDGGITIRAREIGYISSTITMGGLTSTVTTNPDITGTVTLHEPGWSPYEESYERTRLIDKYPELKAKWEEYSELEKHYKAWDLLNKK